MGDISAWVGIGLTVLALTGGCVAYVNSLQNAVHLRISAARDWAENKVTESKKELQEEIKTEREERRREHDRFETVLESFRTVGVAVSAMAEGIRHLGERFEDHRRSTDLRLDEIKQSVQELKKEIQ